MLAKIYNVTLLINFNLLNKSNMLEKKKKEFEKRMKKGLITVMTF